MKIRTFQSLLFICLLTPVFGFAQYPIKVKIPGQTTFQSDWILQGEMEKDKNGENVPNGAGTMSMEKKAVEADSVLFNAIRGKTFNSILLEFYQEDRKDHSLKFYGTMTFYTASITSIAYPKDMQIKKEEHVAVLMVKYKSLAVQQIKGN